MKLIKIDSLTRKVSLINRPPGLDTLYKEIGCCLVEVVPFCGMDLWIDEEGMINGQAKGAFIILDNNKTIFGSAIVAAVKNESMSDCPLGVKFVESKILFCDPNDLNKKDRTPAFKLVL